MVEIQLALFDYNALDTETRIVVQQRTSEIKTIAKRAAQDIVDIGEKLTEVKARLGHGHFGGWLKAEFDWSEPTAQRFMRVAEKFKNVNLTDLSIAPSALYLLAAPSTPFELVDVVLERAEAGEPITFSAVRELKQSVEDAPEPLRRRVLAGELAPKVAKELAQAVQEAQPEVRRVVLEMNVSDPEIVPMLARLYEGKRETFDVIVRTGALDGELPMNKATARDMERHLEQARFEHRAQSMAHVSYNSGENEWYTPAEYLAVARRVMGAIDIDPASSEVANKLVQAAQFFTAADDGLTKDWRGRVWMNPPYAQPLIAHFCEKLGDEVRAGNVTQACVLVNNATETAWFQSLLDIADAVCFIKGRVKFLDPQMNPAGAPLQGQALLYVGPDVAAFRAAAADFGKVLYA